MEYKKSNQQYDAITERCKKEFVAKSSEYGNSLRMYDAFGMLQKIYIKLFRIKTIQQKGVNKVEGETIEKELPGIINYCFYNISLIKHGGDANTLYKDMDMVYDEALKTVKNLFENKNHDYGEAWRELTVSFMVQECIAKYLRAKTIYATNKYKSDVTEETRGKLLEIVSDMCNYSIFCAILISEGTDPMV
jgi:Nucleotide modification associated domain 1